MIRLAVIGAGRWGPNLVRNLHDRPRSEVRWVVDRDAVRLAHVRTRFPEARLAGDAAEALADREVDAVVVATPTSTHHALAKAALEAGKHVLVEKPIATSAREGEELCALAEGSGRILMVGHVFIYNPAVRAVKRYIEGGELGRLHYLSMVRTNPGPIRTDVNAAWDLAAHDLSIASYWLGAEPLTASAVGGAWNDEGLEDAVFATLRYPGGILVNLHVSWLCPRKSRDVTVCGERRMLTFDDLDLSEPLRIYDRPAAGEGADPAYVDSFAAFRASVREGEIVIPKVAAGEPLKEECDHFLECIAAGRRPLTDGRAGVAVVRALEAIGRSMRSGGREEIVEAGSFRAARENGTVRARGSAGPSRSRG